MALNEADVLTKVMAWIKENSGEDGAAATASTNLIADGLLDSLGFLQLVTYLEETFAVSLDPDLLVPENFESPHKIAQLLVKVTNG